MIIRKIRKEACGMVEHFIIMASSYHKGTRIALHYVYNGGADKNVIQDVLDSIEQVGDGKFSYSTHYICTECDDWNSVVSYDPFFEDVYVVESVEEMLYFLKKDLQITGLDVAKYILTKRRCTHLALEKLTYLCYADYLCKYRKRLCEDTIYAFTYGPVVDSVYEKYSHHKELLDEDIPETVAKSRILLLPDGLEKIESIEDTLKKYEKCSASDMVEITHAKGTPWDLKDSSKYYQTIDDDLILERHSVEDEYFRKQFCF